MLASIRYGPSRARPAGSAKGKEGATSADFATDINLAVNYLVKKGYKNIGFW